MSSKSQPLGKYFFICNKNRPDIILAIKEANPRPHTPVVFEKLSLDETNLDDHQLWYSDADSSTIRSKLNGFCLDVQEDEIRTSVFNKSSTSQMWVCQEEKLQTEDDFDMVLSAELSSDLSDGQKCVVRQDEDAPDQRWQLIHIPADFFHIRNAELDLVLDVKGKNEKVGADLIAYKMNLPHSDNQLWFEDETGNIRSKMNQFVIDTSGSSAMLLPLHRNSENQYWTTKGDRVCNKHLHNKCLEIKKKSFLSFYDTIIMADIKATNPLQKFHFDFVPSATEKRTHTGHGKYFVIRNDASLKAVEQTKRNGVSVLRLEEPGVSVFGDQQLFCLDFISRILESKLDNQCLDVVDGNVILVDRNAYKAHTQWQIYSNKLQLVEDPTLVLSHKPLPEKEDVLVVEADEDRVEQRWSITYQPPTYFYLFNELSQKVLDIKYDDMKEGAILSMYERKKLLCENQLWYEDESSILRSKLNGMVIDTSTGAPLMQKYNERNEAQHWVFRNSQIQNLHQPESVLSGTVDFMFRPRVEVQLYSGTGGQRWHILPATNLIVS